MTPPPAPLFQLVFQGECLDGHDPAAVRQAVVAALGLEGRRARRLFSGRRIVVSRGLDMATAHRRIARFAMMGAVLHAEPMNAAKAAPRAVSTPAPAPPNAPAARTAPATPTAARRHRPGAAAPPSRRRRIGSVILMSAIGALLLGLALGPGLDALIEPRPATPSAPGAARRVETTPAPVPEPTATEAGRVAASSDGATVHDRLPKEMGSDARRDYTAVYPAAAPHRAFAISAGGGHGWYGGAATPADAREIALARCTNTRRSPEDTCRVIDVDGQTE